ncbi:unnamed protein product [Candida verbasci]|uniref:ferric-chelate reductase (NADPH) n=1 Tax=Candida verbasci TaxID=1227364 RepID=A0A9W4X8X1_9ASCO|nr:unnamed protein product [Candida verbasci]
MKVQFILYLIFSIGCFARSSDYSAQGDRKYFWGCNGALSASVSFCSPTNYTCKCVDKNFQASIAGCLDQIGKATKGAKSGMVNYCENYAMSKIDDDWYDDALKYYKKNGKNACEIPNFNMIISIDTPFILNKAIAEAYAESYTRFYNNKDDSLYYGAACLGYWLLVLLISSMSNFTKFMFPNLVKKMTNSIINYYRKYLSIPAMFHKKKSQEQSFFHIFSFLILSRMESLIIFLFYCVTIMLMSINLKAIQGDALYTAKYMAEIRYVADRSGIIATIEMPLIFLFAGRNNFLQWLTGFNYSTFVGFHRHTARIMFMLVVIHAVCFTINFGSYYKTALAEQYLRWGITAAVAGGVIMIQSMLYLRRRWYEVFLIFHIILAAFWTAGAWLHVKDLGYIWFVYPSVAVWSFDRVVRIGRLFAFGFPHATVTLLSDETLKVIISKPNYWHSIPGGHAFIHFLKPTYFWQSHPFTYTDSYEDKNYLILYCKVKGGITHSLYRLLVNSPGRSCQVRVSVEGPYGEPTPAKYADSAVFIAGGNGIPGIYSEILDIALKSKHSENNKLKLHWVVREYPSLYWFYEELLKLRNTRIETTIYVTKPDCHIFIEEFNNRFNAVEKSSCPDSEGDSNDPCEEQDEKLDSSIKEKYKTNIECTDSEEKLCGHDIVEKIKHELSHITFKEGRPIIKDLMTQEVIESNDSVAFVTCGHGAMVDEFCAIPYNTSCLCQSKEALATYTSCYVTRPEITTDLDQFSSSWSNDEVSSIEKNSSVKEDIKEEEFEKDLDYSSIINNIKLELSHI